MINIIATGSCDAVGRGGVSTMFKHYFKSLKWILRIFLLQFFATLVLWLHGRGRWVDPCNSSLIKSRSCNVSGIHPVQIINVCMAIHPLQMCTSHKTALRLSGSPKSCFTWKNILVMMWNDVRPPHTCSDEETLFHKCRRVFKHCIVINIVMWTGALLSTVEIKGSQCCWWKSLS